MSIPRTIHDFYGFSRKLFQEKYDVQGAPDLAKSIKNHFSEIQIELDYEWGFDHGTWTLLKYLFPEAQIPVIQLSIDYKKDLQ